VPERQKKRCQLGFILHSTKWPKSATVTVHKFPPISAKDFIIFGIFNAKGDYNIYPKRGSSSPNCAKPKKKP